MFALTAGRNVLGGEGNCQGVCPGEKCPAFATPHLSRPCGGTAKYSRSDLLYLAQRRVESIYQRYLPSSVTVGGQTPARQDPP